MRHKTLKRIMLMFTARMEMNIVAIMMMFSRYMKFSRRHKYTSCYHFPPLKREEREREREREGVLYGTYSFSWW
jgi:hypothetical protein